jgi:site-specific DNA recombinase
VWSSAKYSNQQRLQFLVFPEGIFRSREVAKCGTKNINLVLRNIIYLERVIAEKKNGTAQKNSACAALVEVRGIEPLSKHIRRKLSTCLFPY